MRASRGSQFALFCRPEGQVLLVWAAPCWLTVTWTSRRRWPRLLWCSVNSGMWGVTVGSSCAMFTGGEKEILRKKYKEREGIKVINKQGLQRKARISRSLLKSWYSPSGSGAWLFWKNGRSTKWPVHCRPRGKSTNTETGAENSCGKKKNHVCVCVREFYL